VWQFDKNLGYWADVQTGEKLNLPNNQLPANVKVEIFNNKSTPNKSDTNKTDTTACISHTSPTLVLTKKFNVWAGSANKTENLPNGALILDLADRYGNGLRGDGIELPSSLLVRRVVMEWPDMSKPYLIKEEWETLSQWLTTLDIVREHGLYIACLEGHGRTGTALCLLAHFLGEWNDNVDIVRQIRKKYCPKAVETATQIEYIEKITGRKTTCKASNAVEFTPGNYQYSKNTPCYKIVQGSVVDCQHTCSATSENHKEHWCNKCKWDWWVDGLGLHEKPAPGNQQKSREEIVTPGEHVVKVCDAKGQVKFTETWSEKGKVHTVNSEKSCWKPFKIAIGGTDDCIVDTSPDEEHICGVLKDHPGRHVCMLCGGTSVDEKGYVESLCLAQGGQETDHRCLCTDRLDHEISFPVGPVHTCSTCSKMFEEEGGEE
jgi:hypothetical protein